MALEDTALYKEILAVIGSGAKPVHFAWTLQIVANGATYDAMKVISIDLVRDYDKNYSDELQVEFKINPGTFQHLIMPYKANLLCTLKGTPIGEATTSAQNNQPIPSQQMRGSLIDTHSEVMGGSSPYSQSKVAADMAGPQSIRIQLLDLTLEQVRMKSVGGIVRNTTPGDALKTLMIQALNDLKLPTDSSISGVDLHTPDNTTARDHVEIPHGTPFLDVPDHIHDNCGGIYSNGFGFYLQNGMWYVYPTFDITRFDSAPKTITFINVPKNRFPSIERTYRTTANQTIVLVTGDVKTQDDSESQIANSGNGTRFLDASKILGAFGTVKNNIVTALRVQNNNEYMTEKRTNGLNNAQSSKARITSNPYKEMSKMSRKAGRHVQVVWENANPSLITPNMPCKYMYTVNDQTMEAEGTVVGLHSYISLQGDGATSGRHLNTCAVTLFVDKAVPWLPNEASVDTKPLTSIGTTTIS